jgi:hypothetical protein
MGQFNTLTFNSQLPIKKRLAYLAAAFIIGLMQSLIFFSIMKTFWTSLCMKKYKHGFHRDYTKIKKKNICTSNKDLQPYMSFPTNILCSLLLGRYNSLDYYT